MKTKNNVLFRKKIMKLGIGFMLSFIVLILLLGVISQGVSAESPSIFTGVYCTYTYISYDAYMLHKNNNLFFISQKCNGCCEFTAESGYCRVITVCFNIYYVSGFFPDKN